MDSDETLKPMLIDCLTQQLSEIELLTCMYPNRDDIILTDSKVLTNMKDFIDNKTQFTPNNLDFTLSLHIDNMKLEVSINLPSFYPEEEPDIYVRCNQLNRQQETALNTDLSIFLKESCDKQQCLYTAVVWIQENIDKYNTKIIVKPTTSTVVAGIDKSMERFARFWVFSHHIYNKKKREDIVKFAKEYNLTGFCLPGKPGIICIEGIEYECTEWWKIIKSMCWKKIVLRKSDLFPISERTKEQRFHKFEELHFVNTSSKRSNHADMSEFSKYIEKFSLTKSFNDFFGLCNTNT